MLFFAAPYAEDGDDDDHHDGGGGGGGAAAAGAGAAAVAAVAAGDVPVIRILAKLLASTVTCPFLYAQFRVASQNNRIRNCYYIWGATSAPISSVKDAESGKPWVRFGSSSKQTDDISGSKSKGQNEGDGTILKKK